MQEILFNNQKRKFKLSILQERAEKVIGIEIVVRVSGYSIQSLFIPLFKTSCIRCGQSKGR